MSNLKCLQLLLKSVWATLWGRTEVWYCACCIHVLVAFFSLDADVMYM